MSSKRWIKFWCHSRDEGVLDLAARTGEDPFTVVGRCAEWFRWVFDHCKSERSKIRPQSMNMIVAAPEGVDYAAAMIEMGWLAIDEDGTLIVIGWREHFSVEAMRLANQSLRARKHREASRDRHATVTLERDAGVTNDAQKRHLEQRREEKSSNPPTPLMGDAAASPAASVGDGPGREETDAADEIGVRTGSVDRIARSLVQAGLDAAVARELAAEPNATVELVGVLVRNAEHLAKLGRLINLGGYLRDGIRKRYPIHPDLSKEAAVTAGRRRSESERAERRSADAAKKASVEAQDERVKTWLRGLDPELLRSAVEAALGSDYARSMLQGRDPRVVWKGRLDVFGNRLLRTCVVREVEKLMMAEE